MQPALPHLLTPINSYNYLERNYYEYIKPYSLLVSFIIHSLIALPLITMPLKLIKAPPGNVIVVELVTFPIFEKISDVSAMPKEVKDLPTETSMDLAKNIEPAEEPMQQKGSDFIETKTEPMAFKEKRSIHNHIKVTNTKSITAKPKVPELLNKKRSIKGQSKETTTSFEDVITHWINHQLSRRINHLPEIHNFKRFVIAIKVDNKGKILSSTLAVSSGDPYIDNLYLSNLDQIGPPPAHLLKYFTSQKDSLQFELVMGTN